METDPLDEKLDADLRERRKKAANLKRRLATLRQHERARGPDGKSSIAQAGGRVGGRRRAGSFEGGPTAWGLAMALKRWHGIELPKDGEKP
jgi:hypothetical protein